MNHDDRKEGSNEEDENAGSCDGPRVLSPMSSLTSVSPWPVVIDLVTPPFHAQPPAGGPRMLSAPAELLRGLDGDGDSENGKVLMPPTVPGQILAPEI